jgi:uncharacterized protein with LGFP repeats
VDAGYDLAVDGHWAHEDTDLAAERIGFGDAYPLEPQLPRDAESVTRVSWSRGGRADEVSPEETYGSDDFSGSEEDFGEDPDAFDTTPTLVVPDAVRAEAGYDTSTPEARGAPDGVYAQDRYPDDAYANEGYLDEAYPDVAVAHTAPDVASSEAAAADSGVSDGVFPGDSASGAEARAGRHAALEPDELYELEELEELEEPSELASARSSPAGRPTIHLPLDDPYHAPDGYPIKASARSGLYYTPSSALYDDTIAEVWLSSEEVAQANGFIKAD